MTKEQKINKELAKEGLRLASNDEAGWFVTVMIQGEVVKVWATCNTELGIFSLIG